MRSIRILFADDHEGIRRAIKKTYEIYQAACQIETFENGMQIVERARLPPPFDLVMLDYQMPPGNDGGAWTARNLRVLYPHIPIIFISAFTDRKRLDDAEAAGAMAYISKERATQLDLVTAILQKKWSDLQRLAVGAESGLWFFEKNISIA